MKCEEVKQNFGEKKNMKCEKVTPNSGKWRLPQLCSGGIVVVQWRYYSTIAMQLSYYSSLAIYVVDVL